LDGVNEETLKEEEGDHQEDDTYADAEMKEVAKPHTLSFNV
jgi:hypothetical protein